MARQPTGRQRGSALSVMLVYHATIIIHGQYPNLLRTSFSDLWLDIFRTNDKDKNISNSSSYRDLSPLYGCTNEMQRKVRDDKYKLGLLKPNTFAEDRLLRQPPGVCIMLVMYNRYHNYAARQLRRINENDRFSIPKRFTGERLAATAKQCIPAFKTDPALRQYLVNYKRERNNHRLSGSIVPEDSDYAEAKLQQRIDAAAKDPDNNIEGFQKAFDVVWN